MFIRTIAMLLILAMLPNVAWTAKHGEEKKESGGEAADPETETYYIPIEPPLVINLQGAHRYLRTDIQLQIEGKTNSDNIKLHMPALRHKLIMMLGDRDPATIVTVEEREKLRAEALSEFTDYLEQYGVEGLKDLFFASFLTQ